ncbi:putative signal peptide protein [Puccinia sorghi]|uniref:Putative signal peptide protein n=1 Tax=Puccinia sorghi TaxID=27349 RepID=A0A0L6V8P3_9BASI|nr:putative signal peptide protein [Puccinia sorghi]
MIITSITTTTTTSIADCYLLFLLMFCLRRLSARHDVIVSVPSAGAPVFPVLCFISQTPPCCLNTPPHPILRPLKTIIPPLQNTYPNLAETQNTKSPSLDMSCVPFLVETYLPIHLIIIHPCCLCMHSSAKNTSAMCFWHCDTNGTPQSWRGKHQKKARKKGMRESKERELTVIHEEVDEKEINETRGSGEVMIEFESKRIGGEISCEGLELRRLRLMEEKHRNKMRKERCHGKITSLNLNSTQVVHICHRNTPISSRKVPIHFQVIYIGLIQPTFNTLTTRIWIHLCSGTFQVSRTTNSALLHPPQFWNHCAQTLYLIAATAAVEHQTSSTAEGYANRCNALISTLDFLSPIIITTENQNKINQSLLCLLILFFLVCFDFKLNPCFFLFSIFMSFFPNQISSHLIFLSNLLSSDLPSFLKISGCALPDLVSLFLDSEFGFSHYFHSVWFYIMQPTLAFLGRQGGLCVKDQKHVTAQSSGGSGVVLDAVQLSVSFYFYFFIFIHLYLENSKESLLGNLSGCRKVLKQFLAFSDLTIFCKGSKLRPKDTTEGPIDEYDPKNWNSETQPGHIAASAEASCIKLVALAVQRVP